jgi:hypothetical protein
MDATTMPTPDEAIDMYRLQVEGITDPNDSAFPTLLYGSDEGASIMVLAMETGPGGVQPMLRGVLTAARQNPGKPNWLVFMSEAYSQEFDNKAGRKPHLFPGELQARAQRGEVIKEVVMAYGVHADGTEFGKFAQFRRTSEGVTEWIDSAYDDPNDTKKTTGGIPAMLRAFVAPDA